MELVVEDDRVDRRVASRLSSPARSTSTTAVGTESSSLTTSDSVPARIVSSDPRDSSIV